MGRWADGGADVEEDMIARRRPPSGHIGNSTTHRRPLDAESLRHRWRSCKIKNGEHYREIYATSEPQRMLRASQRNTLQTPTPP
jgi:hypothetical protein